MTDAAWKVYCDATTDSIREAAYERMYGAAHPAPQPIALDMINLCCSARRLLTDAAYLSRVFDDAEDIGADRVSTVRKHRDDLRHMQAELAALVAEAEAA
jgi:hypothetical protein